jgi:hypothetical protein
VGFKIGVDELFVVDGVAAKIGMLGRTTARLTTGDTVVDERLVEVDDGVEVVEAAAVVVGTTEETSEDEETTDFVDEILVDIMAALEGRGLMDESVVAGAAAGTESVEGLAVDVEEVIVVAVDATDAVAETLGVIDAAADANIEAADANAGASVGLSAPTKDEIKFKKSGLCISASIKPSHSSQGTSESSKLPVPLLLTWVEFPVICTAANAA